MPRRDPTDDAVAAGGCHREAGSEPAREGDAVTHFHPTGLAEPSIIHLGTDSNQKATLMIEPLAGRVKVFDDYVEQKTS